MPLKWIKDQKVEANLRRMGIVFEVERVLVSQIDQEEGLRRQARMIGKLDQDYALQLSLKMSEPEAAFPMIILQKPPHKAKMWVWSGNHRFAGFTLAYPDEQYIDAYIVCIKDPVMIDIFPRVVNVWESGLGFSKDEKIMNARWAIENHRIPTKEACEMFGIRQEWIYKDNAVQAVKKVIADIPGTNGISKSICQFLHPLADNINVVRAVVKTICEHHVKGDEARHLINDVRNQNTELQRLGELARWEKLLNERNKPKAKDSKKKEPTLKFTRTTRELFLKNLTNLAKLLSKNNSVTQLQITDPTDLELTKKNWKVILDSMTKVLGD